MFNWFNNLKIRSKLILAFLVIISLTIIISGIDLLGQNYMQNITAEILDVSEQITKLSLQSQNAMLKARQNEKDYFLRYKQFGFTKARLKYVNKVQDYVVTVHRYMQEIKDLEVHKSNIFAVETALLHKS